MKNHIREVFVFIGVCVGLITILSLFQFALTPHAWFFVGVGVGMLAEYISRALVKD